MNIKKLSLCGLLFCCLLPGSLPAADNSYEQNLEAALAQRIEQGEPVWLNAAGDRFLGIYLQQSSKQARGAVIIVHGMGGHPDWPEVIAPLRRRLPAGGWASLSIQMPVLEPGEALAGYGDTLKPACNRIRTAVRYLQDRQYQNIALIGYGFGATTGAYFLTEGGGGGIQAFVGIGMRSYEFLSSRLDLDAYLERLTIPVLDLYGGRDFASVLKLAETRRLEARQQHRDRYRQVVIDGADHYFSGREDVLVQRIREWLDKVVPTSGADAAAGPGGQPASAQPPAGPGE